MISEILSNHKFLKNGMLLIYSLVMLSSQVFFFFQTAAQYELFSANLKMLPHQYLGSSVLIEWELNPSVRQMGRLPFLHFAVRLSLPQPHVLVVLNRPSLLLCTSLLFHLEYWFSFFLRSLQLSAVGWKLSSSRKHMTFLPVGVGIPLICWDSTLG